MGQRLPAAPIPLMLFTPAVIDRFENRCTTLASGCIEFSSSNNRGYGMFSIRGKSYAAHRVAWNLAGRPTTSGLVLDHICENRVCVNVDHLREVTNAFNVQRPHAGPVCPQGHERTPENTYLYLHVRDGRLHRRCRQCESDRRARRTAREKEAGLCA